MTNAKEEFLGHIEGLKVKCAKISRELYWEHESEHLKSLLKVGYTEEGYNNFLKSLDFQYDSGYGSQQVFGTIWFEDGTWSERGEYDGSEWWEHNKLPEIFKELL